MKEIAKKIRNTLFASRPTIESAVEYATNVAKACGKTDEAAVLTAVQVVLNSVADEIDRHAVMEGKLLDALKNMCSAANNRGRLDEGGCDFNTEAGFAYREAMKLISIVEAEPTSTGPAFTPTQYVVTLKEAPHRRAICEKKMRYEVQLNGKFFSEIYFNMRGYVGYLPLPDGTRQDIGEKGIAEFRNEIKYLNKAQELINMAAKVKPAVLSDFIEEHRDLLWHTGKSNIFAQDAHSQISDYIATNGVREANAIRVKLQKLL